MQHEVYFVFVVMNHENLILHRYMLRQMSEDCTTHFSKHSGTMEWGSCKSYQENFTKSFIQYKIRIPM